MNSWNVSEKKPLPCYYYLLATGHEVHNRVVCRKTASLKIFIVAIPKEGLAGPKKYNTAAVLQSGGQIICEGCRLQIYIVDVIPKEGLTGHNPPILLLV